jgi:hypothetical protein
MRLFAAHEVGGRLRKVAVKLAEIREDEVLDLAGTLCLVKPMDGRVLGAIEYRAEHAEHAREQKLARRLLPQPIAGRAANDRVDGNDVEADVRRSVRPQTTEAKIVVDAAVGEDDAVGLERAILFEGQRLVEGREEERIGRRGGDRMRDPRSSGTTSKFPMGPAKISRTTVGSTFRMASTDTSRCRRE